MVCIWQETHHWPHKGNRRFPFQRGQQCGASMLSLLLSWTNGRVQWWFEMPWYSHDVTIMSSVSRVRSFCGFTYCKMRNASHGWFFCTGKEYAKADWRWAVSDPTIVALEVLTVFLIGPLCVLMVPAICSRWRSRHFLQVSLCVCELYGGKFKSLYLCWAWTKLLICCRRYF